MMRTQDENIEAQVPTSVLWSIVTGNSTAKETVTAEYVRVLHLLNPAIGEQGEIAGARLDDLLKGFAKSSLSILYPDLVDAKTEAAAIKEMGSSLAVTEVRPCCCQRVGQLFAVRVPTASL